MSRPLRCGCNYDETVLLVREERTPCWPGLHVAVPGDALYGRRFRFVVAPGVNKTSLWFRRQVRSRVEVDGEVLA